MHHHSIDVALGSIDFELMDYSLDLAMGCAPLDGTPEDETAWQLLLELKGRLNAAHDRLDAS